MSVGGGGGGGLPGNTEGAVMFNTGSAWVARILRGFTADSTQLVGDGTFGEGAANNTWTGKNAYPPSTQQNITGVSGTLNCDATTIAISANGVYEMTSTPTIAAGTRDGDLCFIRNVGANNITLQGSTLIASGLKHPAASPKITIEAGGGTALYQWATGAVKWTLIGAGGGSGSGGTITSVFGQAGPTITDPVTTAEIATPSTPAGGSVTRYAKGGKFCALSSAGVETCTQATPVVFKGTAAMGTGAIASGACAAAVSVAATGVLTTDVVTAGFAADPTATTGYLPGAMLSIIPFPTAGGDSVSFRVCNNTGGSITPGALTINWRVAR